jgi:CHAT domain-containing protein
MLPLLAALALAPPQGLGLEPFPASPFDRVIELEIAADDEPLIDGRGPTVVAEYLVEFEGTLHVWTRSEMDLFLQVDDVQAFGTLGADEDSGGGSTPYVHMEVRGGERLAILVAGGTGVTGLLTLRVMAAPETEVTRTAAATGHDALERARRLASEGDRAGSRAPVSSAIAQLVNTAGAADSRRVTGVLSELGHFAYSDLSDFESSRDAWDLVMRHYERTLPPDHPALQSVRNNLASMIMALGNLDGARALQEQVLEVLSRTLPPDHPDLQAARINLANTIKTLGDLDGARALEEQVLEVLSRTLPADHPDLQKVRLSLAGTIKALGDLDGARELEEQVLEVLAHTLRPDHPDLQAARIKLANTISALGDLDGARALLDQALEVLAHTLPPDHPDLQRARHGLASTIMALGDLDGARALQEQVLEVFSRTLPPDHPDLQAARQNLASTIHNLGDLFGARVLEEQVLEVRSRTLPPDHPHLQAARNNLAATIKALGDLDGARVLEEQVLEVLSRTLPPDHPDLQTVRLNLAATIHALGDLYGARELEEQVLEVRSRTLPPDHPDLLAARQNLASTLHTLGDFDGARELIEQVFEALTRTLPPDHPSMQMAWLNLASTIYTLGDFDGARELQEQVLEVRSRTLPPDHPDLQTVRLNLAATIHALGDLARARELEEQVLEVRSSTLPPDHPDLQAARSSLASTISSLGDLDGARALHEQVLEVRSRTMPADHPNLQWTRLSLAATIKALGDLYGARELEEQVLEVRSRALPPDHPDLLAVRLNMAISFYYLGDFDGARELQEQVLEVQSRTLPPDHPDLLAAREGLAITISALGDLDGARVLFEQVLEVYSRTRAADHVNLQGARRNLAWTLYGLGDLDGARELVSSMLDSIRTRASALHEESPRAARAIARQQLSHVFCALSFDESRDRPQPLNNDVLAALESLRNVSVASPAAAHAIGDHPELADVQQKIIRLRAKISDRFPFGTVEDERVEGWRRGLLELATERDELERELRRGLAREGFSASPIEASSVVAALPSDALAISYLRYPRHWPTDAETGSQCPPIDSLVAFVISSGGRVDRIELGPAEDLEQLAFGWRAALGKPIERGVNALTSEDTEAELGASLRKRILDPLLVHAEGVRVLHVVLDDFLHLVPLEALPAGQAKENGRVGDGRRIQYEVSFGRLLRGRAPRPGEGTLLALGGVAFDAVSEEQGAATSMNSTQRSGLPDRFEPLRQTRYEIEYIAAQYEEAFETEAVLLQMADADKEALRTLAPSARWLHLATHGWFAPETLLSQLDLAGDGMQRASLLRAEQTVIGFAPGTLCGLALAGANNGRDAVGRVPGIITAEELATLDLRNCELAVLSACETNVGIRRAGQGIQSLQTALHAAGARTAITSLWRVDDHATRRLFELFYTKLWKEKLGKADALWQAKMALRDERHPVRDWAGWVLTGDPD